MQLLIAAKLSVGQFYVSPDECKRRAILLFAKLLWSKLICDIIVKCSVLKIFNAVVGTEIEDWIERFNSPQWP